MGVVSVSSSVTGTPLRTSKNFTNNPNIAVRKPIILAFKDGTSKNSTLVADSVSLSTEPPVDRSKSLTRATKSNKRVKAASVDASPPCAVDLDYNEAAAKLENIYKLSPSEVSTVVDTKRKRKGSQKVKRNNIGRENAQTEIGKLYVVRSQRRKPRRLSLEKRIALKKNEKCVSESKPKKISSEVGSRDVERLVRDYSVSTDFVSLDWKKMKIPAVLSSSEHTWLFGLMQPMKALLQVAVDMEKDLGREPTDGELAEATNMSAQEVRRSIELGQAARNKLVKHNLRLVLYVINKYYQELASGHKFYDLCQAGARGLVTAIDRFEPKRGLRLSTYGMFWIRHSIMRSLTVSSFTRVPFGLESIRMQIQKAKLELVFELGRVPTADEIISKVGISPERYHDVLKASKSIISLNAKHTTTQEEFIKVITDTDGVDGDSKRRPALVRLAIDDVLDSLKPKESLVIRQRYGLDGKGDRTLGEIAGNLNISREMVRKYEVKAFMKLKHPARVDYLRRYVV